MRIPRIELENFRVHGHTVLDIGNNSIVIIRGGHAAGKTTIGQAISMALGVTTTGLDAQGRNFQRKIKRGEDKAVITVDIQAKHLIRQKVVLNTNSSGRVPKSICLDDDSWRPLPFDNFLANYKDAILVASNTDYFLRMGEKEQKNLLAKLVLPQRYEFSKEKTDAASRLLGETVDFTGEPFAVIAEAYKKLFQERTIVNRQIKELPMPEAIQLPTGVNSDALKAEIESLQEREKKLRAECDAAVDAESGKATARSRLHTTLINLRAEVTKIQERIDAIEAQRGTEADRKAKQKRAALLPKLQELRAEQRELSVKINAKVGEMKDLEDLTERSECPTCGQELTEDKLKAYLAALGTKRQEFADRLARLNDEIGTMSDVEAADAAVRKDAELVAEHESLTENLNDVIATGKKNRAELDALGDPVDARAPFHVELTELGTKIKTLQDKLQPVLAAEARAVEIDNRKKLIEKLQTKSKELDTLVEYFGKDGIKADLISEHIGGFESKMNAVMQPWGYKIALSFEPYDFMVTNARGDTNPVTEVSGAEEQMFQLAVQCAVSRVAGIGFVVADKMDTFLPKHRQKASAALKSMIDEGFLEQVFIIAADDARNAVKADGVVTYFVNEGVAEKL